MGKADAAAGETQVLFRFLGGDDFMPEFGGIFHKMPFVIQAAGNLTADWNLRGVIGCPIGKTEDVADSEPVKIVGDQARIVAAAERKNQTGSRRAARQKTAKNVEQQMVGLVRKFIRNGCVL